MRVAEFRGPHSDLVGGTEIVPWGRGLAALGGLGIWTSGDGRDWVAVEPSGLEGVIVTRLTTTADGRLLAMGETQPSLPGGPFVYGAWTSSDAREWSPIDLGFSPDLAVHDVASGPLGFVLAADDIIGGQTHAVLLRSTDGLSWTRTYDEQGDLIIAAVGAGPEGFVAVGQHGWATNQGRGFVLASADGLSWFEAPSGTGPLREVPSLWAITPTGADWIAIPMPAGGHEGPLRSEDGLTWQTTATISLPCYREALTTANLAGDGRRVVLSVSVAGDCPLQPPWLWMSSDGAAWRSMASDLPSGEIAMATTDGATVLMVVRVEGSASRVEFWRADALSAP